MRISPVNTVGMKYNCGNDGPKPQAFRGAVLDAAMKELNAPNNITEWRNVWNRLAWAVKKESGLKILNKEFFDKLIELTGYNSAYAPALFRDFSLEGEPDGTTVPIAADKNGTILAEGKNSSGHYLEYYSSDGKSKILGIGDFIDNQRLRFYVDEYNYIDYYNSTGNPRAMKVGVGDVAYFNEDGTRDYLHGFKTLAKGLRLIFGK